MKYDTTTSKNICLANVTVFMFFMGMGAFADTVAWYRFEDQEPRTKTQGGVAVTNCVDGSYPAMPRTIYGTSYHDSASPNQNYLPTYVESAPTNYVVYDPVSAQRVVNRGGLHFRMTGSSDRNGGMLRISDNAALRAITNLTLEAFIRLPTDLSIAANWMRPIILKMYDGYQGTWGLHVFESNIMHRATLLLSDNTTKVCAWGNKSQSARVDDGRWHHLAVTYDFGRKKARSYVDYQLVNMLDMDANAIGFYHPETSPLLIGGNDLHATRRFCGDIDEVRISNEALPPEKFLRYIPLREIDADTAFYLPFDDGPVDWFSATCPPLNAATNAPGFVYCYRNEGTPSASCVLDVPGDGIRAGRQSMTRFANSGAINLPVTAVGVHNGTSFTLQDPSKSVSSGSYTFETFFKTDRQVTKPSESTYGDSFCIFNAAFMKLLINGGAGGDTLFRHKSLNGDTSLQLGPRLDDGTWHHIALVFDADTLTMTGYVDYKAVTSSTVPTKDYSGSGEIRLSGENSGYQTFAGSFDEVRITRRALNAREFLTTRPLPKGITIIFR